MPFETGTLILANYTARVKDTGEVIETTYEEEAKRLGIHDPSRRYEPRLVAVGEGWVLRGVDEALLNANVGDKLTLEVPPEKGFGLRDPNKVKLVPLRKFGERAGELRVGDEAEVENKVGIVRFIGSGRAQLDFNHRFAGKVLNYELEVVKRLEKDEEKVLALIRRRLPIEEEKVSLSFEGDGLKAQLPSELYLVEGLQIIKRAVANDIFRYVKGVFKVHFIELYESAKPQEAKAAQPQLEPQGAKA